MNWVTAIVPIIWSPSISQLIVITELFSWISWLISYCSFFHCFCLLNWSIWFTFRSVIIGAPQAQSSLESQRKINETGAIYKCSLDPTAAEQCSPFLFDGLGNTNEEYNAYTHNSEKKDHQWLGAAIDGNEFDSEKMVVSNDPGSASTVHPRYPSIHLPTQTNQLSSLWLKGVRSSSRHRCSELLSAARCVLLVIQHQQFKAHQRAKNRTAALEREAI